MKNKLALVTGASRGIGLEIARKLAEEGARVALVARNLAALNAAMDTLPGEGHEAFAIDLMTPSATETLVRRVRRRAGCPNIVVHNLGGSMGLFAPMEGADEWQNVWRFNVGIAHDLNRELIPHMATERWGRVVHLSTLSTRTFNGAPAYVSAKCALDGYVTTMARFWAKHGVVISSVAPGAIYSEGRHFAKMGRDKPEELMAYFDQHLPSERLGTARDVAEAVAFLCSESASFMSGARIPVDGGGY